MKKLSLILQQIQDQVVRENFRRIKEFLDTADFGGDVAGPPGPPGPPGPVGPPGAPALFEVVAVSVLVPNTWTNVPLGSITTVSDVEVFDQSNMEKMIIDVRLVGAGIVQIRSSAIYTYTVHVEGF